MNNSQQFDDAITQALERAPQVGIPADFSARVMANLPRRPHFVLTVQTHWGRNMSILGALLLTILIAWVATSSSPCIITQLLEAFLMVQLCALCIWYALRRYRSN